jgi:putative ABC transport system permease protein
MPASLPVSSWTLGWRSLWRDWRAGELRLLVLAVMLAVAALAAVGFFADRLHQGLQRDARALIGGDAVVASDHEPPPAFAERARALGLRSVRTLAFPTMGRAPDEMGGTARLVALKVVEPGYPLRGRLRIAAAPGAPDEPTDEVPAPGTAWVDAALLAALELQVGQDLWLGEQRFRIARVITFEPDRGAGFMSFAPRVLIHAADLAATGLVQPASRMTWRLAVAGEDAAVERFTAWARSEIGRPGVRGMRLESLEEGSPQMQQTLARAEKFLHLVALLAALLSAVAVAITARGFARRHLDDCAMLRVLGVPQRAMAGAYATEFGLVGTAASVLGLAVGYLVHHAFVWLLAGLVETELPPPSAWPVGLGMGTGLTLMAAFGLPPVLQLARVPPLRVIRRDVGQPKPATLAVLGLAVAGFAGLLLMAARDLRLGGIAVGGFAAAVALFAAVSWAAVRLLRAAVNEGRAPHALVLATRQLAARPAQAVVQVSALAVGLLALVLLVLLRTDLIDSWRAATPPDAPDRIVINIQPGQADEFRRALQEAGVAQYDWYPMIRGRLATINGRAVEAGQFATERAQRLVEREFNLSHAAQAPAHNTIVAGRWVPEEVDGLSVEEGLAKELGLALGDVLGFDISGQRHERRITSLRKVDWASMRVNFFVIFPVSAMPEEAPVTYITAFRAPAHLARFDNELVRRFPNVTNVDLSQAIAQVQRVLGQVIRAVEFLFGFALVAGLVVLLATLTASRAEREHELAVLRALGAGSALLRRVQRIELTGVGMLAGVLAAIVAMAVGWALARYAFEFAWRPPLLALPFAGLAGSALALVAGWWSLRGILRAPVMRTLREVT